MKRTINTLPLPEEDSPVPQTAGEMLPATNPDELGIENPSATGMNR